jgi:ABC-type multidrug transport system permease subunit
VYPASFSVNVFVGVLTCILDSFTVIVLGVVASPLNSTIPFWKKLGVKVVIYIYTIQIFLFLKHKKIEKLLIK